MKIIDILENGEIRKKLIQFAKNCSWQSTGSYLAELVNDYTLDEKEYLFGETTAKNVTLGMIAADMQDRTKWIPVELYD